MNNLFRNTRLLRSTVIAISALLLLAATGSAQDRWQIVRAQYGTGTRWADVTRRVQSLVRNGVLDFRVSHDSLEADPAEGQRKSLRLDVRNGRGQVRQFVFADNRQVNLMVTGDGGTSYPPGLQINSAQYGAFHMTDVTARLASLVRDNSLSLRVAYDTIGVDPDEGRTKHLDVNYTYNGVPGHITLRDGETLNLPGAGAVGMGGGIGGGDGLRVLRAEYGTGFRLIDVTSRLNAQVQGNTLELRITNDSMGGDPAHEEAKWLDVWYVFNGRAGHVKVHEKDVLALPGTGDTNYYQNGLQITRAQYGADYRFADVTSRLNSQLQGGNSLSLRITNDSMGGDPAPGERKVLTVFYIYNGRPGRAFANESDVLILPVGTTTVRGDRDDDDDDYYRRYWPGRSASELRVLQASWGAGGQQRDVTGQLNQQVQGNHLNVNVNDGSMGGDPAPGAEKRLRVVYMFRGLRYETNVPEGGVLALP